MMKVGRKLLGVCLIASIISVSLPSICDTELTGAKIVNASTADTTAANNKINALTSSIRNNYLGLKNVGTWQGYIEEARELTSKISSATIKDSYSSRIDDAENVVNAAAAVNQLEKSLSENAHIMKNVPLWMDYAEDCVITLSKVNVDYEEQFYNLYGRLIKCSLSIDKVIEKNNGSVEDM